MKEDVEKAVPPKEETIVEVRVRGWVSSGTVQLCKATTFHVHARISCALSTPRRVVGVGVGVWALRAMVKASRASLGSRVTGKILQA